MSDREKKIRARQWNKVMRQKERTKARAEFERTQAVQLLASKTFSTSKGSALDAILDVFESRLRPGVSVIEKTLRNSQRKQLISFQELKDTMTNLGMAQIPPNYLHDIFSRYRAENDTSDVMNYATLSRDLVQRQREREQNCATSIEDPFRRNGGTLKVQRFSPTKKQIHDVFMNASAEEFLRRKLEERLKTHGNSCGLADAFRKFADGERKISFQVFCTRLHHLGIQLTNEEQRALFQSFDPSDTGYIDMEVFVRKMLQSDAMQNSLQLPSRNSSAKEAKGEPERQLVSSLAWGKVKADFANSFKERIATKVGSHHQLKRAFRIFDTGSKCTRISFSEFQSGLDRLGFALTEHEAYSFFSSFPRESDGTIHFNSFISWLSASTEKNDTTESNSPADEEEHRKTRRHRRQHHRHRNHHNRRHRNKNCTSNHHDWDSSNCQKERKEVIEKESTLALGSTQSRGMQEEEMRKLTVREPKRNEVEAVRNTRKTRVVKVPRRVQSTPMLPETGRSESPLDLLEYKQPTISVHKLAFIH